MKKYHMRRSDLQLKDKNDIKKILLKGKYLNVALCKDNIPYIVCLSYGYDEDKNCLYVHCASQGKKLDFIKHNSTACANIVIDEGYLDGECEHAYSSVVIDGEFLEVNEVEEKQKALIVMAKHLEAKPTIMVDKIRNMTDRLRNVCVFKLKILNIVGKKNNH